MTEAVTAKTVADALLGRTEALKQVHTEGWYSVRMLTTSTAHLPKHTRDDLKDGLIDITIIDWREYGWLLYTQYDLEEVEKMLIGDHKELVALCAFALEEGFAFIRFDADAETLPEELGFPEFP